MKELIKKFFTPYRTIKEQQHLIDNYRHQYEQMLDMYRTEEKRVFDLRDNLEDTEQKISELQDEIGVQKSKAAYTFSLF